MTLDDLMKYLLNDLQVKQDEASSAIESTAKMIAFKYEAELYKVFSKEDIVKANELSEESSLTYLHNRYLEITGEKSEVLLDQITSEIVGEIVKQPRDYFKFSQS